MTRATPTTPATYGRQMTEFLGLLSIALPIVAMIVFFVMARDVREIRDSLRVLVERGAFSAAPGGSDTPPRSNT